ncbi:MAG: hypothetical protein JXB85_00190 [Anaerolineales bacterium]|nr:hypothetical protein [Anaerolineales bacterium]
MPNRFADILKNHLVVEKVSLRELMLEILDLCQDPVGAVQAIARLEAKRDEFAACVDSLEKTPYCCLYLSCAYFTLDDLARATRGATAAIKGLDQQNQTWNRSIARWLCAEIHKVNDRFDDAEVFYNDAILLMERELQDRKRRSRYDLAKECEHVLGQMRQDAQLHKNGTPVYTPALPARRRTRTRRPPVAEQPGDSEEALLQDLRRKAAGDQAAAERLIQHEAERTPRKSRVECIRRAIKRWERDNQ